MPADPFTGKVENKFLKKKKVLISKKVQKQKLVYPSRVVNGTFFI